MATALQSNRHLYDQDLWTWANQQAAALRSAARNEHGWRDRVDWHNLIEEVADMGKSEERNWKSLCESIIEHLLEIQHAQDNQPVRHWSREIHTWRRKVAQLLRENPGMKSKLPAFLGEAWEGVHIDLFMTGKTPETCPWEITEIVGYNPYRATGKRTLGLSPDPSRQAWPVEVWPVLARCLQNWPDEQPPLSDFGSAGRRASTIKRDILASSRSTSRTERSREDLDLSR